jgi:hypothetical protein
VRWERVAALAIASWVFVASPARAESTPASVRVLVSSCSAMDWDALTSALRLELRSMGSDLGPDASAPARLVLDVTCADRPASIDVELSHAQSRRFVARTIPIVDDDDTHGMRSLAVALSELVRVAWPSLSSPSSSEPQAVEPLIEATREIEFVVTERESEPLVATPAPARIDVATFVDLALAVTAYPGSPSALGELRGAVSFLLAGPVRGAIEIDGGAGWAAAMPGDVLLAAAGGALSLRLGHRVVPDVLLEAGLRLDLAWLHAEGVPAGAVVAGRALDGLGTIIGIDARVRARVAADTFFLVGVDLGAGVAGIDARTDDRRLAVSLGPRVSVAIGLSWALGD